MGLWSAIMETGSPPPNETPPVKLNTASSEERNMAMLCHLLALAGLMLPMGNIIGPLVMWLIKKDTMPMVDAAGKESLNFQITVSIALIACFVTIWLILPFFLMIAIAIAAVVFTIIAAIKTSEGVAYRYPWTIRFLK